MNKFKNVKFLLFGFILMISYCFINTTVYAKTITPDEVQGSAYIIGSHVFTREVNEATGYEGKLTTNLIMLASKSIESSDLDNMIIYYKTASGMWINGLTGATIEPPASFEINYTNLQLEDVNTTVSAPETPVLYLDGPLSYNQETGIVTYQLNIFINDIVNTNNKVDGVEIQMVDYDGYIQNQELKYGENFTAVSTVLDSFKGEGLVVGNSYHSDFITIENKIDDWVSVSVKAYVLDDNGKKTYSDTVFASMSPSTNLPALTIVNEYSNPEYISKNEEYYNYRLGIKELDSYMFKVSPKKFAYLLSEKTEMGWRDIGIYGLDEQADVTVPANSVKVYRAQLGHYDENGKFNYYVGVEHTALNEFIIDTRALSTPILNAEQDGIAFTELKNNGEYLRINSDFYEKQEGTLDCQIEGTEIYRVYWTTGTNGSEPRYELVEGKIGQAHVFPPTGSSYYTARVYATNEAGKKVYSDFSKIVTVIRTPEIEVSEVTNGKVEVSIVNTDQYRDSFKFNVYKWDSTDGEVLLETFTLSDGKISIDVTENTEIYVRAYDKDYESSELEPVYVYSEESNKVNIVIE